MSSQLRTSNGPSELARLNSLQGGLADPRVRASTEALLVPFTFSIGDRQNRPSCAH